MNNYRNVIDKFALNTLSKLPNIPDFHLMVGSAECLNSLPLLVYKNASIPKEVVENMNDAKEYSLQDISEAVAENQLEINDLNWNLALIGSGLGV